MCSGIIAMRVMALGLALMMSLPVAAAALPSPPPAEVAVTKSQSMGGNWLYNFTIRNNYTTPAMPEDGYLYEVGIWLDPLQLVGSSLNAPTGWLIMLDSTNPAIYPALVSYTWSSLSPGEVLSGFSFETTSPLPAEFEFDAKFYLASGSADTYSGVAAIPAPEPSTFFLLAAGLGVAACGARALKQVGRAG